MLAVAQVAHLHSNPIDADHCQLCMVMHAVMPMAAAAAVIMLVPMGVSSPQAAPVLAFRQRQFRLFIRPPPSSCHGIALFS
jgi:hypothetical protein